MKIIYSKEILLAAILISCQTQSRLQEDLADVSPEELAEALSAIEEAVPLAEKDPYRPIYHYRPPAQSLSDICAAFYHKGWHHIFYQFHPFQDHPGRGTGWGHARSKGLVNWEFLPPPLLPDKSNGSDRDASGSAFFNGEGDPMLFFSMTPTGFYDEGATNKREQWAAVPVDEDFIGWRRIDIGLAPGKSGVPEDIHRLWADMFVFEAEGRIFGVFKESEGMVVEPQNPNLLEWKVVGRLDDFPGECPNLFPLNEYHVLIMSTYPIQYRIGYFDADKIALDSTGGGTRVLDYGPGPELERHNRGFYATTVFQDSQGRTVLLGWISGFKSDRGWSGCMGLPRILTIDENLNLIQTPLPELNELRGKRSAVNNLVLGNEEKRLNEINGDALEIIAEFEAGDATAFGLKIRQSADGGEAITMRYDNGNLNIAGTEVPLGTNSERLKLHVFLDKSVLEVFINDGITSVSQVEYAREKDIGVSVFAEKGSVKLRSLEAWEMKSIW